MDRIEAIRALATVASRESDPKIRKHAKEALEFLEKDIPTWAVLKIEHRLSEEARVEVDYEVLRVYSDNDAAVDRVAHLRNINDYAPRAYVVRRVWET